VSEHLVLLQHFGSLGVPLDHPPRALRDEGDRDPLAGALDPLVDAARPLERLIEHVQLAGPG
jgi:hypothetical protein